MAFETFADFMAMGKHGPYVWSAYGITLLVVVANVFVANNTVAIVLTGEMARDIAEDHGVDLRRSASVLDIFSCVVQGLIPYGAQVLLACSIAGLSPLALIGAIHYCWALAVTGVIAIVINRPRLVSLKQG